jgi:hypothetical protein
VQHCAVANARPVNWFGRIKECLDLVLAEVPHQSRLSLLHWNGEDALDLLEGRRNPILYEVHE